MVSRRGNVDSSLSGRMSLSHKKNSWCGIYIAWPSLENSLLQVGLSISLIRWLWEWNEHIEAKKQVFFPFEIFKSQGFVKELKNTFRFHRISWMALFFPMLKIQIELLLSAIEYNLIKNFKMTISSNVM